jgi:exopolysaccharide biosynthesis predicted pyruvyltransferase EpsI
MGSRRSDDTSSGMNWQSSFNAISVREQSGIHLCKEHLGVEAVQVLDPTLLLDAEDYRKIYGAQKETKPYIATYVLDRNKDIQKIVKSIAKATGLEVRQLGKLSANGFAPIEDWLSGIDGAKYVITDSFHGSVFSILFHTPFITLGNIDRGMSRFQSLLKAFDLNDRLIVDSNFAQRIIDLSIDWKSVDDKLKIEREKGLRFLDEVFS